MMFRLHNGTAIHLRGIVQVADYQRPSHGTQEDAVVEVLKNATKYVPAPWGRAPIRLTSANLTDLPQRLQRGKLP